MRRRVALFIPILFITGLLFIGTLQIWYPNTKSLVDITKVGLSWPVLSIIFLSVIVYVFEEPIRIFLLKIKGIYTDKIKIDTQQEEDTNKITVEAFNNFVSLRDSEWQQTIDNVATAANDLIKEKEDMAGNLANAVNELQEKFVLTESERIKWHFRYADRFLAARTKLALKIISMSPTITVQGMWDNHQDILHSIEERDAIFNALLELEFVEKQLNEFYVSTLGNYYIDFLETVYKVSWVDLRNVLALSRRADIT